MCTDVKAISSSFLCFSFFVKPKNVPKQRIYSTNETWKSLFQYVCLASFIRFRIVKLLIHPIHILLMCSRIYMIFHIMHIWALCDSIFKNCNFSIIKRGISLLFHLATTMSDFNFFHFDVLHLLHCMYKLLRLQLFFSCSFILLEKYCNDMVHLIWTSYIVTKY